MSYKVYKIKNDVNNRIYIGRTANINQLDNHLTLLEKQQHYNALLQKDYNNGGNISLNILFEFDKPEDAAMKAITLINDGNLINPIYGYNTFFDREGISSRTARLDLFDEDILMCFLLNNRNKMLTLKRFGINNNVFKYRLRRNGVLTTQKILISSYKALYAYSMLVVALSDNPITASEIQCRLFKNFDVSKRLMINAHKISKNLRKRGIHSVRMNNFLYYEVV